MKWARHRCQLEPSVEAHGVHRAVVGVRDHEGGAGKAPGHQPSEKGQPPGLVPGRDHVHAEHLPVALGIHASGDDHGHVLDAPASRTFSTMASSQT